MHVYFFFFFQIVFSHKMQVNNNFLRDFFIISSPPSFLKIVHIFNIILNDYLEFFYNTDFFDMMLLNVYTRIK